MSWRDDTAMHFLTAHGASYASRGKRIGKPWACVMVRVERTRSPCRLRVEGGVHIMKPDAIIAPLPEGTVVLSTEGEICEPTGRFYVTVESFDPIHMLVDLFDT